MRTHLALTSLSLLLVHCSSGASATSPLLDPTADDGSDAGGSARAPDPGAPRGGGAGDDAGAQPPAPDAAPACMKGALKPSQVVMLGDSYLDPTFSNAALDLFADAQKAGSLGAKDTYRHYYLGGAAMSGGSFQLNIPYQYEQMAKKDDPNIDTIVMDGGGNDVLINDRSCLTQAPPQNAGCAKTVDAALGRAKQLLDEMATDGVKHVVYFFYPHLDPTKTDGFLFGGAPAVNDTLDYAYPLARAMCEGATMPKCVFVDTRPAFAGHTADYIKSDNVHPTPAGAQVIADLVWQAMVDNCIAQ
jgi:lysophospholipase L1-like esterase